MNNQPAFPIVIDLASSVEYQTGMTLRDYFAAKAMQGLVAASLNDGGCVKCDDKFIAPLAYQIADEMMEARKA
jgi:hypothetical protein